MWRLQELVIQVVFTAILFGLIVLVGHACKEDPGPANWLPKKQQSQSVTIPNPLISK